MHERCCFVYAESHFYYVETFPNCVCYQQCITGVR